MTTDVATTPEGGATLEGGSYEVIRRRLGEQARELAEKADALNLRRKEIFGGTELALIANERVRTENNCIPRDMVSIAGHLLFGFQVFLGLKAETNVPDVFSLHKFERTGAGASDSYDLSNIAIAPDGAAAFLADGAFTKEFKDVFRYVKDAQLAQLRRTETRLLAVVKVGAGARDVKVFRWAIDAAGRVSYMDARGEEDNAPPEPHDFEWTVTTRDDHVPGPHPHVNILNEVFVETVGGDLTVKIENNTKDGLGIYREPVDDPNQALDDGEIAYAKVGILILLRVKPFRETAYRYLVYNTRTEKVVRIDALGLACIGLPEDHGIVFPGGYYLQSGESKVFDTATENMQFDKVVVSPNGEDVLYVFYRVTDGQYVLMPYNLIRKEVQTPIRCHGYSLFSDGTMAVFRAAEEATRVHPIQIWRTPFTSAEFAAAAPTDGSYLAKVGNKDLVRGISDVLSLRRLATTETPTRRTYEDLIAAATRTSDAYYWLGHAEAKDLLGTLVALRKTSELIIDEFEKLIAIRKRADEALDAATKAQGELLARVRPDELTNVDAILLALTSLRAQRGALITLKELRGVELSKVDALEAAVVARFEEVTKACVAFLLSDGAFKPLIERLDALVAKIEAVAKASELATFGQDLDVVHGGLTLLGEVVSGLAIDDATARTRILEGVGAAFAQQNRARATFQARKRELSLKEGRAEFAAQFTLFGQSVTSALALCDSPERCDEQLSKVLAQLEGLEARFGELDEFLADLASKRQEVNDAIGTRRQTLVEERQRRAQNVASAADRILTGIARRARTLPSADELNAYFASDAMVQKAGELAAQLAALGDSVRADEVQSRLKSAKQDALRVLRDRNDLYEEGGAVIKLGDHRFSVHDKPLELTLVPHASSGAMTLHLTGTDFYEPIDDPELTAARDLWEQTVVSETPDVYRGEYLAVSLFADAEDGVDGLSIAALERAVLTPGALLSIVRTYAEARLDEGYDRGVHDADAALILEKLLGLSAAAGRLRYTSRARASACLFWAALPKDARDLLQRRARSLGRLRAELGHGAAQAALARELEASMGAVAGDDARASSRYLVEELAADRVRFATSAEAVKLKDALLADLEERGARRAFEDDLRALEPHDAARLEIATAYVDGFLASPHAARMSGADARPFAREAAVLLLTERALDRDVSTAITKGEAVGLLGQHPRIEGRTLRIALDDLLARAAALRTDRAPRFRAYRKVRAAILERERARLRLDELTPRVLTSFVRNRLIDEVYLPLIGANLAKQIGAVGEKKRTDLMGLLLLISPPGYGKTTLMEYVASKLGLIFMKVNGPALGHEVTSLDPNEAKNATARQEVQKINLVLEMGNNVMLYLDDIQHTSSELLQKFISLCDAQRRIEGVWRGKTRTYDLRGKKFCVVMAGNPYTESGARFQIPDMLANRADTYNLGEILDGKADLFALSYLENALTSNATLAPLAGRDAQDVHKLLRMAQGEEVALTDLAHGYSSAEALEIKELFARLFEVQKTLLIVNANYIASASQDDAFRSEPPFKLQGSYRNMSKLAEKVVSAMNPEELQRLISDHYQSESQTLTTGAEQNLLKLAELRGVMTEAEKTRWQSIKESFQRTKRMGGADSDPVARVTGTLSGLDTQLQGIRQTLSRALEAAALDRAKERDAKAAAAMALAVAPVQATVPRPGKSEPTGATGETVTPGLVELLAQQLGLVERALVPLVKAVAAQQSAAPVHASDPRIDELFALVKKVEASLRSGIGAGSTPRFDVTLGQHTDSNFYAGLGGGDLLAEGGLFVATYGKLPSVGARVAVRIAFPGGAACEATGTVAFQQEFADNDGTVTLAGFGVRLGDVEAETRRLVAEYTNRRVPMLRDG